MEAPEKLYILFNKPYTVDYTKLNKRLYEEQMEYIRTDVFIKKTRKYFIKELPNFRSFMESGQHLLKILKVLYKKSKLWILSMNWSITYISYMMNL